MVFVTAKADWGTSNGKIVTSGATRMSGGFLKIFFQDWAQYFNDRIYSGSRLMWSRIILTFG
jgi:hypothetical protein